MPSPVSIPIITENQVAAAGIELRFKLPVSEKHVAEAVVTMLPSGVPQERGN